MRVRKMLRFGIVAMMLFAAGGGLATSAQAADRQPPNGERMQAMASTMAPMMSQMIQGMMEATFVVLENPQTGKRLAVFTRNYYDALVEQGFPNDEALKIIMSVGIPGPPGAK